MPVAEFPGRFGWGYDGVDLFAPTRLYGRPDDLRRFVDEAHRLGLGVILDVVYNHLGPDGMLSRALSRRTTSRTATRMNGASRSISTARDSGPVREFFVANARYWIEEFHLDGLRLDATQSMFDASRRAHPRRDRARRSAPPRRRAAPTSSPRTSRNTPAGAAAKERGGYGLDSLWNDDFHHSAMVALTGRNEAYYSDYWGKPQEFVSMARARVPLPGPALQMAEEAAGNAGARPRSLRLRRLPPEPRSGRELRARRPAPRADQPRPAARGDGASAARAGDAHAVPGPGVRVLRRPSFTLPTTSASLRRAVSAGRREFLAQFPSIATAEMQARLADPSGPQTFVLCKLDLGRAGASRALYRLHRDLIRLRREDAVISRCGRRRARSRARWSDPRHSCCGTSTSRSGRDRLLLVNFGRRPRISIRSPSRSWRHPRACNGRSCGRASTRTTAAPARRLPKAPRVGESQGTPPCCWPRRSLPIRPPTTERRSGPRVDFGGGKSVDPAARHACDAEDRNEPAEGW